jgi:hypothetical protein
VGRDGILVIAHIIFERDPAKQFTTNSNTGRAANPTNIRALLLRFGYSRADRTNNFDLSLFKNFRVTERFRLQFRAESFDAVNHVQFANPNTGVTNIACGVITGEKGRGGGNGCSGSSCFLKLAAQAGLAKRARFECTAKG